MKGTLIKEKGVFFVEYSVVASEPDEIEIKKMRLSFENDFDGLKEGDTVNFECKSFSTVGDLQTALIKR